MTTVSKSEGVSPAEAFRQLLGVKVAGMRAEGLDERRRAEYTVELALGLSGMLNARWSQAERAMFAEALADAPDAALALNQRHYASMLERQLHNLKFGSPDQELGPEVLFSEIVGVLEEFELEEEAFGNESASAAGPDGKVMVGRFLKMELTTGLPASAVGTKNSSHPGKAVFIWNTRKVRKVIKHQQ